MFFIGADLLQGKTSRGFGPEMCQRSEQVIGQYRRNRLSGSPDEQLSLQRKGTAGPHGFLLTNALSKLHQIRTNFFQSIAQHQV